MILIGNRLILKALDLVVDPIWPAIFEIDLDIIKTNILTQFQAAKAKIAASKSVNKIFLQFGLVT